MNDWTIKDFRKAAFAVGFGFVMGKAVAEFVNGCTRTLGTTIIDKYAKQWAEEGSESAQKYCRKYHIKYESNDDEPKMKMGFC